MFIAFPTIHKAICLTIATRILSYTSCADMSDGPLKKRALATDNLS